MSSLQGQFLIASSDLRDPNFARTVVLMVTHSEQGALGLVLNRKTNVPLKAAWDQMSATPCQEDVPIFLGGPCQGPLMAVHTQESLADCEVFPGVYFTARTEQLSALVSAAIGPQRYFVGHAGWGPGQLENELNEGSWITGPAITNLVFELDELDTYWERVLKNVGEARLISDLKIKHVPRDLSMN